ncbi:unnamed protein product [Chondrus crispus]|uniref:peptidylprolyl isomerase n=1 Tax=Chondrus crispus TaxID=2769 RepID=S0F3J6_CHOCR|nr:unnamed protein product [Chondrus crispus]CDF77459.1 unnamed protein product [Chondrus crispus]|eukprot:XP_005712333.1 unnamed protein product [Chondrus crispus]
MQHVSKRPARRPISRRASLQLAAAALALQTLRPTSARVRVADADAGSKVVTTESGLSYYDFITADGDARPVTEGTRVSVHYTLGTTGARNGWKIDSSYDRDPLTFTVGRGEVVQGLDEGVLGMGKGGKRRVVIPSKLGYRTKDDRPVVMGFAEYQRFKNIYLNPDRPYKPDLVIDVTVVKVR